MNKFNKLYNVIMENYYVKDIPQVNKFFEMYRTVFRIVEKKMKEDPSLVEKIKDTAQQWIKDTKDSKAKALLIAFTKKRVLAQDYGLTFTPEDQQTIDHFQVVYSNPNINNYLHHNATKIITLAARAGVNVRGIAGGKPQHGFYTGESVVKQSYDPADMYSGVYEPCYPGEEFELKVDQLFNMMERQIKKNPKLLDTLQWKIDYSVNKGTPIERAILLHICALLRVQKISFEQKDLIQNFYNYFGDVEELKELLSLVPLRKLAQNIGLNV